MVARLGCARDGAVGKAAAMNWAGPCLAPRSPAATQEKVANVDERLARIEKASEQPAESLSQAQSAVIHLEKRLAEMLLQSPESPMLRAALLHHAERLQQQSKSSEALPLLQRAVHDAVKAAGAGSAEALAARAQLALCLFEAEKITEAHAEHQLVVRGYDALLRNTDFDRSDRFVDALANTLYLCSHFVQPKSAPSRRRQSFEPESWELMAAMKAMEKQQTKIKHADQPPSRASKVKFAADNSARVQAPPPYELYTEQMKSAPLDAAEVASESESASASSARSSASGDSVCSLSHMANDHLAALGGVGARRRGV